MASREMPGAVRPSGPTVNHGAYSGLVRSFASLLWSKRRFHQTRLSPASAGPFIVRTTLPDASAMVSVTLSVGAAFPPRLALSALPAAVSRGAPGRGDAMTASLPTPARVATRRALLSSDPLRSQYVIGAPYGGIWPAAGSSKLAYGVSASRKR